MNFVRKETCVKTAECEKTAFLMCLFLRCLDDHKSKTSSGYQRDTLKHTPRLVDVTFSPQFPLFSSFKQSPGLFLMICHNDHY